MLIAAPIFTASGFLAYSPRFFDDGFQLFHLESFALGLFYIFFVMFLAMAAGFILMRKIIPHAKFRFKIFCGILVSVIICVSLDLTFMGSEQFSFCAGLITSLTLASISTTACFFGYQAGFRLSKNSRGSNGVLVALWLTGMTAILLLHICGYELMTMINKFQSPQRFWQLSLWETFIIMGAMIGYRSVWRCSLGFQMQIFGVSGIISETKLSDQVEAICVQEGLRVQPFMLGRVCQAIKSTFLNSDVAYKDFVLQDAVNLSGAGLASWGVTSFFREPDTLAVILDFFRSRPGDLRISVAGVSTGEEAYSVVILADIAGKKIFADAIDLNARAIEIALNGVYNGLCFSNVIGSLNKIGPKLTEVLEYDALGSLQVKPDIILEYFSPLNNGLYTVKQKLKKNVVFRQGNLIRDYHYFDSDCIVFRNVIPHIDIKSRCLIIQNIFEESKDDSILVLGQSDLSHADLELNKLIDKLFVKIDPGSTIPVFTKRLG